MKIEPCDLLLTLRHIHQYPNGPTGKLSPGEARLRKLYEEDYPQFLKIFDSQEKAWLSHQRQMEERRQKRLDAKRAKQASTAPGADQTLDDEECIKVAERWLRDHAEQF